MHDMSAHRLPLSTLAPPGKVGSALVVDVGTLLEWLRTSGLVALDLQIDTSTPGGKLAANVFAAVAEWERGVIGERTRLALGALRADGAADLARVGWPMMLTWRLRGLRNALRSRQEKL